MKLKTVYHGVGTRIRFGSDAVIVLAPNMKRLRQAVKLFFGAEHLDPKLCSKACVIAGKVLWSA